MIDLSDTSVTPPYASAACCRVLIVDDDDLIRARIASLLGPAGYDVDAADSGEEALTMLGKRHYHIVVTDWEMPGIDGPALCRAVRLKDGEQYTYILMFTVREHTNDLLAGLDAGANDYLVKACSAEELLARMESGRRTTSLVGCLRLNGDENHDLSMTDPLTGARNRRYLMNYLPSELHRARRYCRPLALLSCDVDEFKRINECFGHEAGDQVLQAFVARAAECIREEVDWVVRAGGEEFVIVLPETTLTGANEVAERFRQAFSARPIATSSGALRATVSLGATALETSEALEKHSVVELLRIADQGMYASKKLGRNRTTCVPLTQARATIAR